MRPGCGSVTMAVLDLAHGLAGDLKSETIQEVLFSCYDAIFVSQLTGLVTPEKEQNNSQCQRAITLQRNLIARWR
ncbi:hypothetical protein [Nocardia sp. NPDC004722]